MKVMNGRVLPELEKKDLPFSFSLLFFSPFSFGLSFPDCLQLSVLLYDPVPQHNPPGSHDVHTGDMTFHTLTNTNKWTVYTDLLLALTCLNPLHRS